MKAVLIVGRNVTLTKYDLTDAFVVGIDYGAYEATKQHIKLDLAVGDFDSITEEELLKVKENSKKIIQLNPVKDESDTFHALELVKDYAEITILGGIAGKRFEHFYANLLMLKNNPKIDMLDDNTHIYTRSKSFTVDAQEGKFFSFFAITNAIISLKGFKYPLTFYHLSVDDALCLSNEVVEPEAQVAIQEGRIFVFVSKNDRDNIEVEL